MRKALVVLMMVVALVLGGCFGGSGVTTKQVMEQVVEFGPLKYTMQGQLPEFRGWDFFLTPVAGTEKYVVLMAEGSNKAKEDDEWVILYIGAEIAGQQMRQPYLIGLSHIPSIKKIVETKGREKGQFDFVDKQYVETGVPSFVLSKVEKIPDLKRLIALKSGVQL